MNFYWVYIIIPLLLFGIYYRKKNKLLLIYWIFVVVFSYDNVTDFVYYTDEFLSYKNNIDLDIGKGREILWVLSFKMLTFTDYGAVIMHIIVMLLVVVAFQYWSKKLNILNYSILFYFLMNLVWKHDNILRQNVAMVLAYICFFKILTYERISFKIFTKMFLVTIVASLFHYSALLIIPYCYVIRWLSTANVKISIVFVLVLSFVIISQLEMVGNLLQKFAVFFTLIGDGTSEYYLIKLQELETTANGKVGVVLSIFSLLPLFYFKIISKKRYNEDKLLRICVNLSWISIVWRNAMSVDLLSRPIEYFLWFQVWGAAYFFDDVFKHFSKHILMSSFGVVYLVLFVYQETTFIHRYYSDNNYMTIFTKECQDLRIYDRENGINGDVDYDFKRVR